MTNRRHAEICMSTIQKENRYLARKILINYKINLIKAIQLAIYNTYIKIEMKKYVFSIFILSKNILFFLLASHILSECARSSLIGKPLYLFI